MSLPYRLAAAEARMMTLRYFDVPQVFACTEGENTIDDLILKDPSPSSKCVNQFFDVVNNVQCDKTLEQIADVLALDETEVS